MKDFFLTDSMRATQALRGFHLVKRRQKKYAKEKKIMPRCFPGKFIQMTFLTWRYAYVYHMVYDFYSTNPDIMKR